MARNSTRLVALASAIVILVAGTPAGTVSAADRTLRPVRLDTGGLAGQLVGINAHGQIVGYLQGADPIRPALWRRNGALVEIGVLGESPYGLNNRGDVLLGTGLWSNGRLVPVAHPSRRVTVSDVNDRRQVVGSLTTDFPLRITAFRWKDGRFTELPTPEGMIADATAVNQRGDVLGHISESFAGPTDTFVWRDGVMSLLGLSVEQGNALDINDRGQVIGYRYVGESGTHPFLWQRGATIDLMAGRPDRSGAARDINNAGDVVGFMDSRPVLWRHGRATLIGPADWTGGASAINEHGDIAGSFSFNRVEDQFDSRVFLWRNGRLLLSELIKAPIRPYQIGIDERGRIAGGLTDSGTGESHPVVWTTR